jgi:hypothetical protein
MENNYYCNDEWFDSYEAARSYSDVMVRMTGAYHVVYTRAELDSQVQGMVDSIINHIEECGK